MKLPAKRLAVLSLLAGTLLAMVGCGSSSEASGDETSGGPSGTVVWYSGHNPTQNDLVIEAFNEQYPDVNVEVLRLAHGELAVRYAQERDAGQQSADVLSLSGVEFIEHGHDEGWWVTDAPVDAGFPADAVDRGAFTVGIFPLELAYNTDNTEAPKNWEDVLDPSFKGQIVLLDPRAVPAYLAYHQLMSETYGDEFLVALSEQDFQLTPSGVPGSETLAAGGHSIMFPTVRPALQTLIDAGAPLESVNLAPTTGDEMSSLLTTNGPNPDNGAIFFEFLSSKAGQEAFNGNVLVSLRDDVDSMELPAGYVPIGQVLPKALEREAEILSLLGIS